MRIKANISREGRVFPAEASWEDGTISGIRRLDCGKGLPLLVPGFFDVHTHGADRIDVNRILSYEDVNQLSKFYASRGVTSFLASVMTDAIPIMEDKIRILSDAMDRGLDGADLAGIHLEGPFLSPEYCGAMDPGLVKDADWGLFSRLNELSGNRIRYITLAPERPGMLDMIRRIRRMTRCVVSMGHSSAEYEEAMAAVDAGVASCTHTFNAMKLFHMHRPAISGCALERDEVYTEIIPDGFHLHPAAVRLIVKTKGWNKVVAITDSIMAAGLPDGKYKIGANEVVVKNRDARRLDGVRAGSTLTMDRAFRNIMKFTGMGPGIVSKATSENPARMLGFDDRGVVEVGRRADWVLLDPSCEVIETVVGGTTRYRRENRP